MPLRDSMSRRRYHRLMKRGSDHRTNQTGEARESARFENHSRVRLIAKGRHALRGPSKIIRSAEEARRHNGFHRARRVLDFQREHAELAGSRAETARRPRPERGQWGCDSILAEVTGEASA